MTTRWRVTGLVALVSLAPLGGCAGGLPPRHYLPPAEPGQWHLQAVMVRQGPDLESFDEPVLQGPRRGVLVEACRGEDGKVRSVRHIGGGDAGASAAARKMARQLGFRPGKPTCQQLQMTMSWSATPARKQIDPRAPRMLAPLLGRGHCASCPEPQLANPGRGQVMLFKICVTPEGLVSAVRPIWERGKPGEIDEEMARAIAVVQQWKFNPYLLDGQAVPFCFPERFR